MKRIILLSKKEQLSNGIGSTSNKPNLTVVITNGNDSNDVLSFSQQVE
jgi:hypothetical protein